MEIKECVQGLHYDAKLEIDKVFYPIPFDKPKGVLITLQAYQVCFEVRVW